MTAPAARSGRRGKRADATRHSPRQANVDAGTLSIIEAVADRALWLAVRMIHEANVVRPNIDGIKVGGHQASSASVATILTTLYLQWLRRDDLVSIKPHASPLYHALTYLLGATDKAQLSTLRAFGGLQAYPSRTKDPDRVDFSTGSVGLGAVAPLFAALADRYLLRHPGLRGGSDGADAWPDRRFVAVVGDAELDEGNVWEAAMEPALVGLGNVTLIVDANRQSLDRVVPGMRIRQLEALFGAAGWQVLEAKYGVRLSALMAGPGGGALRRRIDDMSNEEYQVVIRRPGREALEACIGGADAPDRDEVARSLAGVPEAEVPRVLADLGGHDPLALLRVLDEADGDRARPAVIFAYTIKGWGLPFAGDTMNHAAVLAANQLQPVAEALGANLGDPWAAFPADSPAGRRCRERGVELDLGRRSRPRADREHTVPSLPPVRDTGQASTQQAFSDALASLARVPEVGPRIVTASPDVTISTSLGGWVNRVGVFSADESPVFDTAPRLITWKPGPGGQHIELGISEMNLFMWLSQFGLSAELLGVPLVPIGTVYDPFICRGLDALVYGLYGAARFILVGTPSGVTLAPEGGAHQSTITPSIGIELPGMHAWEPAFAQETVWLLEESIRGVLTADGFSSYLRLSTRPVDQSLAAPVRERLGFAEWRRQVIAGGYRLIRAADVVELPVDAPVVNVVAVGAVVADAIEAVHALHREEVAANLLVITSADRLAAELHDRRLRGVRDGRGGDLGHLAELLPVVERRAPMVTVHDGASHALGFLGGAFGAPVVPLGVDSFGQSGTIPELYATAGIDADHILEAALSAIELG